MKVCGGRGKKKRADWFFGRQNRSNTQEKWKTWKGLPEEKKKGPLDIRTKISNSSKTGEVDLLQSDSLQRGTIKGRGKEKEIPLLAWRPTKPSKGGTNTYKKTSPKNAGGGELLERGGKRNARLVAKEAQD